jgi:ribulose kinase
LDFQELGLVAGIPVGTSLIDAHAGGVGLMESVPLLDSEARGYYGLSKDFLIIMI